MRVRDETPGHGVGKLSRGIIVGDLTLTTLYPTVEVSGQAEQGRKARRLHRTPLDIDPPTRAHNGS